MTAAPSSTQTGPWEFVVVPAATGYADLGDHLAWTPIEVPGTAAAALVSQGDRVVPDCGWLDDMDVWFRTRVTTEQAGALVRFDGVATVCEVLVDGVSVATHRNMFTGFEVGVDTAGEHDLSVLCRGLATLDVPSRPRARWRTQLAVGQHLRWFRTSLLGRMPGWAPTCPPVGPWRPVSVIEPDAPRVTRRRVRVEHRDGLGEVIVDVVVAGVQEQFGAHLAKACLVVGTATATLHPVASAGVIRLAGSATIHEPNLWWPSTHGSPDRYDCAIELHSTLGTIERISLGPVGFRELAVDRKDGAFSISMNGVAVFCRGACWMPLDPLTMTADRVDLECELRRLAAAGVNMLRVPGTTVYESDDFYDLCDELGILVWQDVMLANYDYPTDDPEFRRELADEVGFLAERIAWRPSVVVLCGGSEVEQQAAMNGVPRAVWETSLAHELLVEFAADAFPTTTYVTGSPSGRPFPFSPGFEVGHYYGVGAYLRDFTDVRRAHVHFASECLAFAGVPTAETVLADHPEVVEGDWDRWDAAVVRDRGATWDFQDVRDHYVSTLFGIDGRAVRDDDPQRYLELGRAAVHACIHATFSEWRRTGSASAGGLILQSHDVRAGAGWGIIDRSRRPKSGFFALADVSRPQAVLLTDEGLNGLWAHVVNDRPERIGDPALTVVAYDVNARVVAEAHANISVAARSGSSYCVDELIDGFRDLTQAYRFGEPFADVVEVRLEDGHRIVHVAHYVPGGLRRPVEHDLGLAGVCRQGGGGTVTVEVSTVRFAQYVHLELSGDWSASDNWFHLAPATRRIVHCTGSGRIRAGAVHALNAPVSVPLTVDVS